jgi:ABC-type multidrug transport system ATPase subunit
MLEVERMAERVAFIKRGEIISTDRVSRVRRAYGSIERYWLRLGE